MTNERFFFLSKVVFYNLDAFSFRLINQERNINMSIFPFLMAMLASMFVCKICVWERFTPNGIKQIK